MLVLMLVQKINLVGCCFKRLLHIRQSRVVGESAKADCCGLVQRRQLWLHLACTRNRGPVPSRSMVLADLHKAPKYQSAFYPPKHSVGTNSPRQIESRFFSLALLILLVFLPIRIRRPLRALPSPPRRRATALRRIPAKSAQRTDIKPQSTLRPFNHARCISQLCETPERRWTRCRHMLAGSLGRARWGKVRVLAYGCWR